MRYTDFIALRKGNAIFLLNVTPPSRWKGEQNCIVGPFSSEMVADCFTGHFAELMCSLPECTLFLKGDSWYVEVGQATEQGLGAQSKLTV
jgi:hypothetical protein